MFGRSKPRRKLLRRAPAEQPRGDLGARFGVGGGGERGQRHIERRSQFADAQVVGPEIVAPLADAMRLVHGDQPDADAPQQAPACRAASRSGAR